MKAHGGMKSDALTFERVARLHMTAEPERQQAGLRAWAAALAGDAPGRPEDEPLYTLTEIGKEVRKHPSRLHRLEIQQRCGERIAGRFMYRKSRVMAYLQSAECQARIIELRTHRKAREQSQKAGKP
jgi:hypothetical protein